MLPGLERELVDEVLGHGEGHGDGVLRQPLDRGDGERMEARPVARGRGRSASVDESSAAAGVVTSVIQMALNSSKGSRHALHRRRALQAVEPKWAISEVSVDPQRGQATT